MQEQRLTPLAKRTKIICTLGPSTEDDEVLRKLIQAGMNVARLNFSHGTHDYHQGNIERLRRIEAELGARVAIMVDTKGPEIRTKLNVEHKPFDLVEDSIVRISPQAELSEPGLVAIDYPQIVSEVGLGETIFIDDGLIALHVVEVAQDELICRVANGGRLAERKGVNIPNVAVGLPNVTEQDREDIRFACEMNVDAIAASFIREADAVKEIRELCHEFGKPEIMIISKIESALSLDHLDEILAVSDGIMVARGDLGVEIPAADVPLVQKDLIARCNRAYRPVITATQMLESMCHNPRPTRAETTDVANAILDGTDCVMLSGETAAGEWPVESVLMMAEVCRKTESMLPERTEYHDRGGMNNVSGATGYGATEMARIVGAKALLCPTLSGRTARIVSEFRPHLPIYAISPLEHALRRTCFYWGVEGFLTREEEGMTQICYSALTCVQRHGLLHKDDLAIIMAGDPLTSPLDGGYITSKTSSNVLMIAQAF